MREWKISDLLSDELLEAFARLWPERYDLAANEARKLVEYMGAPTQHRSEIRETLGLILIGLVGDEPDEAAWVQAIAAGSFELRREQRYARPPGGHRPSREINRAASKCDKASDGPRDRRMDRQTTVCDGVNLLVTSCLLKEFRGLATGPCAVGPAWPLMVAVDNHWTAQDKRNLHQVGNDPELHKKIAAVTRAALDEHIAAHYPEGLPAGSRAAQWRREIPPGADTGEYFSRGARAVEAYRTELFKALGLDRSSDDEYERSPEADARRIRQTRIPGFSYLWNPDGSSREPEPYTEEDVKRLRSLLPLLTRADAEEEMYAAAVRARRRHQRRERSENGVLRDIRDEIKLLVGSGMLPPANMALDHAFLFEEEACYAFFEGGPGAMQHWTEALSMFPQFEPSGSYSMDAFIDAYGMRGDPQAAGRARVHWKMTNFDQRKNNHFG